MRGDDCTLIFDRPILVDPTDSLRIKGDLDEYWRGQINPATGERVENTGQGDEVSGAAFLSRHFAPGAGIPADPVTGSIHSTLVPHWSNVLGGVRHQAFQASSRFGWLDCELAADRVLLRGLAVTFMGATIQLRS